VQCPVLVMAGALDPVTPLEDTQKIAAAIPAPWGRLAVFDRAGHGAWRDMPDEAMAVLREFVATP
jgi:pimeloyl-ACP methyl ester carboxylesterase